MSQLYSSTTFRGLLLLSTAVADPEILIEREPRDGIQILFNGYGVNCHRSMTRFEMRERRLLRSLLTFGEIDAQGEPSRLAQFGELGSLFIHTP